MLFNLIFILLCSGCEALVEEINTYQLHPEKRALLQTPRTTPRNTTPKTLCIVGGLSGFDSPDRYLNRADVLCLEDEKKWGKMASMREARESAGTVASCSRLHVSVKYKYLIIHSPDGACQG